MATKLRAGKSTRKSRQWKREWKDWVILLLTMQMIATMVWFFSSDFAWSRSFDTGNEATGDGKGSRNVEGWACRTRQAQETSIYMNGKLSCSGTSEYNDTRNVFSVRLRKNPAITAQVKDKYDVALALRLAEELGMKVTMRGGGHDPAAFSLNEGGMVIDTRRMNQMRLDPDARLLHVGAGALWRDVYAFTEQRGFLPVGGGCPSVGVAGLASKGGVSWFSRGKGLVADNWLEAEIVLANASTIRCSKESHGELFWALRGAGGSNFGCITELVLKVYPIEAEGYLAEQLPVYVGPSPSDFFMRLEEYFDLLEMLKDRRLTVDAITLINTGKNGIMFSITLAMFFDGPFQEGLSIARPLLEFAAQYSTDDKRDAILSGSAFSPKSFKSWVSTWDIDSLYLHWKSALLPSMKSEVMRSLAKAYLAVQPSPGNFFQVTFEHLGGAIADVKPDKTAYVHRNAEILVSINAIHVPPLRDGKIPHCGTNGCKTETETWATKMEEALRPYALGSYAAYSDEKLESWAEKQYGARAYARLQKVKASYGASVLFDTAQRVEAPLETSSSSQASNHQELQPYITKDRQMDPASLHCPEWGSTGWQDLRSQTALVTGGTSGIGLEVARRLIVQGSNVLLVGSNSAKCQLAALLLNDQATTWPSSGRAQCASVDLSNREGVRELVHLLERKGFRLNTVVLAASSFGIAATPRECAESIEVEHFGHIQLVTELLDHGIMATTRRPCRIIIMSSGAAEMASREDVQAALEKKPCTDAVEDFKGRIRNYGALKALNQLWAVQLDRQLASETRPRRATVHIAFPGGTALTMLTSPILSNPVWTESVRSMTGLPREQWLMTPWEGSLAAAYLASTPSPAFSVQGCVARSPCKLATDSSLSEDVWRKTMMLLQ